MKTMIASFAVVLTLCAAQYAAAQDESDIAYQTALLALIDTGLSPADKKSCGVKPNEARSYEQNACCVTLLFIADIDAGRTRGVPPMVHIKYARTKEEKGKILDRM